MSILPLTKVKIGVLLCEQRPREAIDREKELNLYRSRSAPPTVEGSPSVVGGLFNHGGVVGGNSDNSSAFAKYAINKSGNGFMLEEELRSDLAYYLTITRMSIRTQGYHLLCCPRRIGGLHRGYKERIR
ncbi:unnamed protein product [Fraxinus pennsylvanica]|uniref:Uncharacterized protein n=1 Tax=Fraxinus pennsylvanica TaxID=56036 RepID=A0AAD2ABA6_9LAMI|nr:unnamed protein product [Fraxinus pennsylvanica]